MNYKEAREYVDNTAKYGSILGLDTIRELLRLLDNPQEKLEFVHIAGTNGKGSTLAFISNILKYAGYKVGRYSSPSVFTYREMVQVDGKNIEKDEFANIVEIISKAVTKMVKEGFSHPTSFEIETALAFCYFKMKKCHIVVLEAGLGGRLDATNIIQNTRCAVFTSISLDHMGILGDTIGEIAENKAGIIKEGTTVVTTNQEPDVMNVLEKEVDKYKGQIIAADFRDVYDIIWGYEKQIFSYKEYVNLEIQLAGKHQIGNAVLAVEVSRVLNRIGFPITIEDIRKGLREAIWEGRFTLAFRNPLFFIDGAHNIDAVNRLKESIEEYFPDEKIIFIMGVFKDKAYKEMVKMIVPLAKEIFTITPRSERGLPAKELARVVTSFGGKGTAVDTIKDAVEFSKEKAKKEGIIIAFGSLSYLGELKQYLKNN